MVTAWHHRALPKAPATLVNLSWLDLACRENTTASISLTFTAEYAFESYANIMENKPSIIINVEYPPCLSGTDFLHQIVDPLMVNAMLEMKGKFSDVAEAVRTKVFTDVKWSNLSSFTSGHSVLPMSAIPAPSRSSLLQLPRMTRTLAQNPGSIIPRSPTTLPPSQIPVARRARVSSMQPLAPPPQLGRALHVGPHASRTPSREPMQREWRVDTIESTTSTPLARSRMQDATTMPSRSTASFNGHARLEHLGHGTQVHIAPLALPGNALSAGHHGGACRHGQGFSLMTERSPFDPPPPYCSLHHGCIYVVTTNGVQ
ncbi:hypothetical protein CY34DRAFT_810853 [Suillus luteus UH-Slu-Lm8-n1]|uniref:Uncharacterized protein n=1 Tax=Suillus luteus UH-Slu-Lm8-n1 TaxID=930992 RepID=A0A0D0A5Q2_9AGAM|nr:hypothetical protein CY34DRAFT_810853 [Suillus luteus UH-Slu-Lm8-n1]